MTLTSNSEGLGLAQQDLRSTTKSKGSYVGSASCFDILLDKALQRLQPIPDNETHAVLSQECLSQCTAVMHGLKCVPCEVHCSQHAHENHLAQHTAKKAL